MNELSIFDAGDIAAVSAVARRLRMGEVIAVRFNGAFALVGDIDCPSSAETIFRVKNRPRHKTLAMINHPEQMTRYVDHGRLPYDLDRIIALQTQLHAIGVILPADHQATPSHTLVGDTILNVWTEHPPLRNLLNALHMLGGRALHGASANPSGQPTLACINAVTDTFAGQIAGIYIDQQIEVDPIRQRSTSLLDLTTTPPTLRREGNVSRDEIGERLAALDFGRLQIAPDLRWV